MDLFFSNKEEISFKKLRYFVKYYRKEIMRKLNDNVINLLMNKK